MNRTNRLVALAGLAIASGAVAQPFDQQWQISFNIDTGSLAGQSFTGLLEYNQSTLLPQILDGELRADANEFAFTATLPGGAVLTLADDPGAIAFFGGTQLIGLNYLGDNGIQAVNTNDLLIDLNNRFRLFLDADFTPEGEGSMTFTQLNQTDVVTVYRFNGNSSIDDTQIRLQPSVAGSGDENFEGELEVSVDDDDGPGSFNPSQILIRFNDLIGTGDNQVPAGSTILGAVFRVELTSPGSGFTAHRMLTDWDPATVTWNSLTDGVTPGTDAFATPDYSITGVGFGVLSIDLTASLQAFVDGEPNFGFALLPISGGTDGVDFFTSEATAGVPEQFFPPRLTVTLQSGRVITLQEGQNGFAGTADTTLRQQDPTVAFGSLNTTSIDLNDGGFESEYLLRYDGLFGSGPNQIDPFSDDAPVSATLEFSVTSEGAGVALHELLFAFDEIRDTWNTLGGDGITADDLEATLNPLAVLDTDVRTDDPLTPDVDESNPAYSVDSFGRTIFTIDVTSSLQNWFGNQGSNNFGWAFIPQSTNGWDFDAEGTLLPPVGPQLYVSFIPPACPADLTGDGIANIFDIFAFFNAFGAGDIATADFTGDGTLNIFDIFEFFNLFGQGC